MDWMEAQKLQHQAIIGLTSIALQHILDENYDKAEDTLRGMIMTLEKTRGEA